MLSRQQRLALTNISFYDNKLRLAIYYNGDS